MSGASTGSAAVNRQAGLGPWVTLFLPGVSAGLLLVSFAPVDFWPAAYLALVPWSLASARARNRFAAVLAGWLGGVLFWGGAMWWLLMPTVLGYVMGVLYLSLYWVLATVLIRNIARRGMPFWIALPLVWVGLEFLRSRVIPFEWFFLSQSQYRRVYLIQVCDITGQYGLSFFVAMVNGAAADICLAARDGGFRGARFLTRRTMAGLGAAVLTAAVVLAYGTWQLGRDTDRPGPAVGVVQEAFPITLAGRSASPMEYLDAHIARTVDLAGKGCDLVAWPETVIPSGLNRELLAVDPRRMGDRAVRSLVDCFARLTGDEEPAVLRGWLARTIGLEETACYRSAAARYVLSRFATPAILARVDERGLRVIGTDLFGATACRAAPAEDLRTALALHGRDFDPDNCPPARLRRAAELVLAGRAGAGTVATGETGPRDLWGQARRIIAGRIERDRDEKHRETKRCKAAMIAVCSAITGCPIFAGGTSVHRNDRALDPDDAWVMSNSVMKFNAGGVCSALYAKVHLVPFSEYVPFKYTWPSLYGFLRGFIPSQMPQLEPGERVTRFHVAARSGDVRLVTPVCYEGTFSGVCRRMIGEDAAQVLVNISNDGWFVCEGDGGRFRGTTEQYQHLVHYVFRAVELRVPVYRAVNTGISAAVDADGRIVSAVGNRDGDAGGQTMIAGTLRARLPVDRRITTYTITGDLFGTVVFLAAAILVFLPLISGLFKRKE